MQRSKQHRECPKCRSVQPMCITNSTAQHKACWLKKSHLPATTAGNSTIKAPNQVIAVRNAAAAALPVHKHLPALLVAPPQSLWPSQLVCTHTLSVPSACAPLLPWCAQMPGLQWAGPWHHKSGQCSCLGTGRSASDRQQRSLGQHGAKRAKRDEQNDDSCC